MLVMIYAAMLCVAPWKMVMKVAMRRMDVQISVCMSWHALDVCKDYVRCMELRETCVGV